MRLTFATVGETISVDRPIAGRVRAVSTVGQTIVLDDPTNSLTVSTGTGSADVVNVSELSVAFPGGFVIRDEDGVVDDSIVLNGPLANTSGGVELTGSNVDLDFSVNAAGPLLVGAASAAGNVVIATADISSSGNQEYRHAVLLDASPTLIATNGALTFLDSVNSIVPATDDLSIVAGAAVNLDGEIGTATRLRSLDVDSTGQPITIGGDIVTSENQRYRDAVEVAGAAAIGLSSLVGEIRFDAALDDAIPESTELTLTAPSLMLGGSLGSTNRLLSVTLNPGGALSTPAVIRTRDEITITVPDTAATGDTLTIPAGSLLQSLLGDVVLTVGDELQLDATAAIDAGSGNVLINLDPAAADPDAEGGLASLRGSIAGSTTIVQGGDDADLLVLPPPADAEITTDGVASGSVLGDGSVPLTFNAVETVDLNDVTNSIAVSFSVGGNPIDVTQPAPDTLEVASSRGQLIRFAAPTQALSVLTGNGLADTIQLGALALALPDGLLIDDTDNNDTLRVVGTLGNANGGVTFRTLETEIEAPINLDGSLLVGDTNAVRQVRLSTATIDAAGIEIRENLSLNSDATLTSLGGSVVLESIDGARTLTVTTDDSASLLGAIGDVTRLSSFDVTAPLGIELAGYVATNGDQTYSAPATVDNALLESQGGAISLDRVDGSAAGAGNLSIETTGQVTIGNVGDARPLSELSVTGGVGFSFSDTDVTGDVSVTLLDSAGTTELLELPTGVTVQTGGDVMVTASDTIRFAAGATVEAGGSVTVSGRQTDEAPFGVDMEINAAITTSAGTQLFGTDNEDLIRFAPQATTRFAIDGDDPAGPGIDLVVVDGGGADATIEIATGEVTIGSAQPFSIIDIEELVLDNINTLTLNGSAGPDSVSVSRATAVARPDSDLVEIDAGLPLGNVATIVTTNLNGLIYNGRAGDDAFSFDATAGIPSVPVTFHGQTEDLTDGGDRLSISGNFNQQILNYDAPATDGNSGSIDLDGTLIRYTGLEPIVAANSVDSILNFGTGLSNDATLRDALAIADAIELIDNGTTFENTSLPNPTNSLTVTLGDFADTLTIEALDPAFSASVILNGGAG